MEDWVNQLGLTWLLDPLLPRSSGVDMEEFEPKVTIGAITILLGGRESIIELAGNTLALAPFEIELGLEELDFKLPSAAFGSIIPGLGLFWECLEQAPASKIKGLVTVGQSHYPTKVHGLQKAHGPFL